jgi:hypothetical protein
VIRLGSATAAVFALATTAAVAAEAPRSEFLVFSQCKPGKKEFCDRWYAKHLDDIRRIEGIASARELAVVPVAGRNGMKKDRLIIYEIDGDPAVVLGRLTPAVAAGRLQAPDPELFETPFETAVVKPPSN